jgi:hypothetical protein
MRSEPVGKVYTTVDTEIWSPYVSWMPIKTAPRDCKILGHFKGACAEIEWCPVAEDWFLTIDSELVHGPTGARHFPATHWQPLPSEDGLSA